MRQRRDQVYGLWHVDCFQPAPPRRQDATLPRPRQCIQRDTGRFLWVAAAHTAKANVDRCIARSEEIHQIGRRLPAIPFVEEPVTSNVELWRPVLGAGEDVAAVAVEDRRRATRQIVEGLREFCRAFNPRPVVYRHGVPIMVDDDRLPLEPGEKPQMKVIRFRTLGCYPLSGAIESSAATLPEIIREMLQTTMSERQGRVIDHDAAGSMEEKKKEGYF